MKTLEKHSAVSPAPLAGAQSHTAVQPARLPWSHRHAHLFVRAAKGDLQAIRDTVALYEAVHFEPVRVPGDRTKALELLRRLHEGFEWHVDFAHDGAGKPLADGTPLDTLYEGLTFASTLGDRKAHARTHFPGCEPRGEVSPIADGTLWAFNESFGEIEVKFEWPVCRVSLDVAPEDPVDTYVHCTGRPYLSAYDAHGELIQKIPYNRRLPHDWYPGEGYETLTLHPPQAKIASIRFSCHGCARCGEPTHPSMRADFTNLAFTWCLAGTQ